MKKFIYTVLLLINSLAVFANREAGAWSESNGSSFGETIMKILAIPAAIIAFVVFLHTLFDSEQKTDFTAGCLSIALIVGLILVFLIGA